jgi:dUTP pyrophosphatase
VDNSLVEKEVLITKLPHLKELNLPFYATSNSAGLDLTAAIDDEIVLSPGKRCSVPTGIAIALPCGCEAQIRSRSGLAIKYGVVVLNSPGTVDADYRGEVSVLLINHGVESFIIHRGDRVAQMVIAKHVTATWKEVKELPTTSRGEGGFGSTGYRK